MATKRYSVPNTSYFVTTDLAWALESNVSSNATYQSVFKATLNKYSNKGVQTVLGNNIVQIGVVDSNSDVKEGVNYSAALSVLDFLNENKLHEGNAPTVYLIKLNESMMYALGLRGPRVIIDKTISINAEEAEMQTALDSLQSECDDHNLLYNSDNAGWKLVVLSNCKVEKPSDSTTEEGESNSFTDNVQRAIQATKVVLLDEEYTLTSIFSSIDKKKLHAIRNIAQLKRTGPNRYVFIAVILAGLAGSGYWYKSHLDEADATRLALMEQQAQERILALKEKAAATAKQATQTVDIVEQQRIALEQEHRWIKAFEVTDVSGITRTIKEHLRNHPTEINGWDLESVSFSVRMDLIQSKVGITVLSKLNNTRTQAPVRSIANKFNNINIDLGGGSVVVTSFIEPSLTTAAKRVHSDKATEIELISLLQSAKNEGAINVWGLRNAENKRPLPLPNELVQTLAANFETNSTELTSDTWLQPLKKYVVGISGTNTTTLDDLDKVIRNYSAPLLISNVQYNMLNQNIQMEFVTYAYEK